MIAMVVFLLQCFIVNSMLEDIDNQIKRYWPLRIVRKKASKKLHDWSMVNSLQPIRSLLIVLGKCNYNGPRPCWSGRQGSRYCLGCSDTIFKMDRYCNWFEFDSTAAAFRLRLLTSPKDLKRHLLTKKDMDNTIIVHRKQRCGLNSWCRIIRKRDCLFWVGLLE